MSRRAQKLIATSLLASDTRRRQAETMLATPSGRKALS